MGAPGQRSDLVATPLPRVIGEAFEQADVRDGVDVTRFLEGLHDSLDLADPGLHAHRLLPHPIIDAGHGPIGLGHRALLEHAVEHPAVRRVLAQQQHPARGAVQPVQGGDLVVVELAPRSHHHGAADVLALRCAAQPVRFVHCQDPFVLVQHVEGDGRGVVVRDRAVEPYRGPRFVRGGRGDDGAVVPADTTGGDLVGEPRGVVRETLLDVVRGRGRETVQSPQDRVRGTRAGHPDPRGPHAAHRG